MNWELEKLSDEQLVTLFKAAWYVNDIQWMDDLLEAMIQELAERAVKQLGLETN